MTKHTSVAPEIDDQAQAADRVVPKNSDRAADDAEPWQRAKAKDQGGQEGKQEKRTAAHDTDRQNEIAAPANRREQQVEQPNQDGATEDEIGVAQRRVER